MQRWTARVRSRLHWMVIEPSKEPSKSWPGHTEQQALGRECSTGYPLVGVRCRTLVKASSREAQGCWTLFGIRCSGNGTQKLYRNNHVGIMLFPVKLLFGFWDTYAKNQMGIQGSFEVHPSFTQVSQVEYEQSTSWRWKVSVFLATVWWD